MSKIRVLPDHLANQIAAGEVVERPASVVKELLENALDAGAARIDIHIEGDGTRLIRIADNGAGMDQDDVLLSLERHATSKLIEESQLAVIATLGFRGEALPSIGSVSRMTVLSRLHTADIGTRADIRYGTLHAVHDDGCAAGTVIEVRGLFGNLPARKKFLKTKRTELFHIEEVIRDQSLAHPEIAFFLQVDGRRTVTLSVADEEQRIREVLRYQDTLLPIRAVDDKKNNVSVTGCLLLPDKTASARLRILVNKRPVQDRMIRRAVIEGLRGFLMKGRQPSGALLLELSPELIDINVHPAKREIRFRHPKDAYRWVVKAVADAIQRHQESIRSELFNISNIAEITKTERKETKQSAPPPEQLSQPEKKNREEQSGDAPRLFTDSSASDRTEEFIPYQPDRQYSPQHISEPMMRDMQARYRSENAFQLAKFQPEQQFNCGSLTLIGQFLNLYLLCEHADQLVVIDQHAAHERILYQQLRHAYEQQKIVSQNLLFPVTIELGPDHAETLEQEAEAVIALGVVVEFSGDSTWVIKAVPAMVGGLSPGEVLLDILNGLADRPASNLSGVVPECIDRLLASMACKAAVKAGNKLRPEEMLELLQQMGHSEIFSHCPHGRPVLKTFSRQEIEKWFRRS